jgi:hypothetical protein
MELFAAINDTYMSVGRRGTVTELRTILLNQLQRQLSFGISRPPAGLPERMRV